MDKSLKELCAAIRKLYLQIKPINQNPSFVLITGKVDQGKSTLLRQSNLRHITIETEPNLELYYCEKGIILEMDERWLLQSKHLLGYTVKKLNRCHAQLRVTGLILCVDIHEVFNSEPDHLADVTANHTQLLHRFSQSFDYPIDLALIFTKLDGLAGFCEFFQNEHASELKKPLGFSLYATNDKNKFIKQYRKKYEAMIEALEQQVLAKIHPVRSSIKRTLIREFPFQIASLRLNIQSLLKAIPLNTFRPQTLYFTSAEQGGYSQDRLIKKIKHEYALTVQEKFHQSANYRPYFIDGALNAFLKQTQNQTPISLSDKKWAIATLSTVLGLSVLWIGYRHQQASQLIDLASKELIMYETMQGETKDTSAEYHLTKAQKALEGIYTPQFSLTTIKQLKEAVGKNAQDKITGNFLPSVLNEIEQVMLGQQTSPTDRYQALKIYMMLSKPEKFSQEEVIGWFNNQYSRIPQEQAQKRLSLLKQVLREPRQPIAINHQIVADTRNYLNALPSGYLYYAIAKSFLVQDVSPIAFDGIQVAYNQLPSYLTKERFAETLQQLPKISETIQQEDWVLGTPHPDNLTNLIQQGYCYEYISWWKNFIAYTQPEHIENYQQAYHLVNSLVKTNGLPQLVKFIQEQTSPDFDTKNDQFNEDIASQFAELNIISQSALNDLAAQLSEMNAFLSTLAAVRDHGKTAFILTRARFNGDTLSNPLSVLFNQAGSMPPPISNWTKQIAGELWYLLIKDSQNYINQQWQQTIYQTYQDQIAGLFPFNASEENEVSIRAFDVFFAHNGQLHSFINEYIKPFLDTSNPKWEPKEMDGFIMPFSADTLNELMRANVITNMFFQNRSNQSHIEFSLQKINLDPVIEQFRLTIGNIQLKDTRDSHSFTRFSWPRHDAAIAIKSASGELYELEETGPWAFFRILQKVNVLMDEQNTARLQILFEVNGNSGRYILQTQNPLNPFTPGVLTDFTLPELIA